MRRFSFVLLCLVSITGCSQQSATNNSVDNSAAGGGGGAGVLSSLRAKADPAVIAKMKAEEAEAARKAQENAAQMGAEASTSATVSLPQVSDAPFAPPAEQAVQGGPIVTPVEATPAPPSNPFWPFGGGTPAPPKPPEVASYGSYGGGSVPPPPPGAASGGLVPPPPAVSLSTQAQPLPFGMPMDPYANPYANPYAQQPAAAPAAPARPNLFGSGGKVSSNSDDDAPSTRANKKLANFVPITPTGMESRSAYKVRDDLKVLWKGAVSSSSVGKLAARDEKVAAALTRIDVGLPSESTKGSFNASQRQVDAVFKPMALDKRIDSQVKKLEKDLVEGYYRYLYTYNKFALAQQTVAARKQEVEVSGSAAEQQRATADLAQAQSEAESAKEDMRSAQYELSAVAGAQAARGIIGRVSGVAPSVESLAQGDTSGASAPAAAPQKASAAGGLLGGMGSMFGFGRGPAKTAAPEAAKAEPKKAKGKKGKPAAGDLAPAPQIAESPSAASKEPAAESSAGAGQPVAFELKNVNITPRKSVLKVSIRNNGSENFSFDPDVVSISEGNRKLSEATVRAEFDTTLVQPNQEVTGTITIFGRPWNDRLSVSLSEGGRNIQLRR